MKKEKRNVILLIILIYLLIFQNILEANIGFLKYLDEFIALLYFPYLIISIKKSKTIKKDDFVMILLITFFILFGLLSNCIYEYQKWNIILVDVILCIKFFLVFLFFESINNDKYIDKYSSIISKNIKVIITILFILTVLNYLFEIFPMSMRYGIKVNSLFYTHSTFLAGAGVFLLICLYFFNKNIKLKDKYVIMNFIIILSTLRIKAIGFCIVAIMVIIYENRIMKKFTLNKLIVIGFLLMIVFFQQISFYYIEVADSARSVLLKTSFKIMKDYFPIGTGFGTFASAYSTYNYSPVYSIYRIQNIRGISINDSSFVSDCFWPMIFGQFGLVGTIIYIILLKCIMKKIQNSFNNNNLNKYISKILALIYLLIASTSESAFVNPIAIPLAIIIAL